MFSFFVNDYEPIETMTSSIAFGDFSLVNDAYVKPGTNGVSVIDYLYRRGANNNLSTIMYNTETGNIGGALILETRKMGESSLVKKSMTLYEQKGQDPKNLAIQQAESIELLAVLNHAITQNVLPDFVRAIGNRIYAYTQEHRNCKYIWLECSNGTLAYELIQKFGFNPLEYNADVLRKEINKISMDDFEELLGETFIKQLPPFGVPM